MFSIVPKISTPDGQTFDSIDEARKHQLIELLASDPKVEVTTEFVEFLAANHEKIADIMTAEPGDPPKKPRKRRKDAGVPRKAAASAPTPPASDAHPAGENKVEGSGKWRGK